MRRRTLSASDEHEHGGRERQQRVSAPSQTVNALSAHRPSVSYRPTGCRRSHTAAVVLATSLIVLVVGIEDIPTEGSER
jgi:hypothetical protein